MKNKYAIPVAALAMAGATGCSDPILGDWELTRYTYAGQVADFGDKGYRSDDWAYNNTLEMSVSDNMSVEFVQTLRATFTDSYYGEMDTLTDTDTFPGDVVPGSGSKRGTYRIDIDYFMSLECEFREEPVELSCDQIGSPGHWYFEPT